MVCGVQYVNSIWVLRHAIRRERTVCGVWCGTAMAECGTEVAECGTEVAECGTEIAYGAPRPRATPRECSAAPP
eukprot:1191451-Rhodomonas_salina.1